MPPPFPLLAVSSQLEAKGQAVLDILGLSRPSPPAPASADASLAPCGELDAWVRPSGQGNSPFSASGSDSEVDVVADSREARPTVTDAESDSSAGGVAEAGKAKGRGDFLEDDNDSGMNYREKLAFVKDRQVNASDSEFVPSGEEDAEVEEGEGEGEEEEEDNVSVQSFSSGDSSGLEASSARQRKAGASRKQRRVVDDEVNCSFGNMTMKRGFEYECHYTH